MAPAALRHSAWDRMCVGFKGIDAGRCPFHALLILGEVHCSNTEVRGAGHARTPYFLVRNAIRNPSAQTQTTAYRTSGAYRTDSLLDKRLIGQNAHFARISASVSLSGRNWHRPQWRSSPYAGPPLPKIGGKRQVNSDQKSIGQFLCHESCGNATKKHCLLARL